MSAALRDPQPGHLVKDHAPPPPVLPVAARDKIAALRSAADDAEVLASTSTARLNDLQKALASIRKADDADAEAVKQVEEARAEAQHALDLERAVQQKHQARRTELMQTCSQIAGWTRGAYGGEFVVKKVTVKLKAELGETAVTAISGIRSAISSTRGEMVRVNTAPLPKATVKKLAAEYVQEMVGRAAPKLRVQGEKFTADFTNKTSFGFGRSEAVTMLAWLDPAGFTKRLHAEIDAQYTDAGAMSAYAKAARLAQLGEELDQLEREEEAMIVLAAEGGQTIPRRHDASVLAVLGIVPKSAAKAA